MMGRNVRGCSAAVSTFPRSTKCRLVPRFLIGLVGIGANAAASSPRQLDLSSVRPLEGDAP